MSDAPTWDLPGLSSWSCHVVKQAGLPRGHSLPSKRAERYKDERRIGSQRPGKSVQRLFAIYSRTSGDIVARTSLCQKIFCLLVAVAWRIAAVLCELTRSHLLIASFGLDGFSRRGGSGHRADRSRRRNSIVVAGRSRPSSACSCARCSDVARWAGSPYFAG